MANKASQRRFGAASLSHSKPASQSATKTAGSVGIGFCAVYLSLVEKKKVDGKCRVDVGGVAVGLLLICGRI